MDPNAAIDLPQGTIRYRDTGSGPPIVFVHGLLVDGTLWRGVTALLSDTHRCIAPDWPLGSHTIALNEGADRSPRGVAHLIADFLEAMSLDGVTVVANDTGGAITQILVTERPERIGRLVLTNCDAYENFLPPAFRPLQWIARIPGAITALIQPMRAAPMRRSPLGFGLLTKRPVPDEVTRRWLEPSLRDVAVRRDATALLRAIDSRDTLAAAERLGDFERPALLVWGRDDPFFKLAFAERLAAAIPGARLVPLDDCRAFVPEDQPARLAELIAEFVAQT